MKYSLSNSLRSKRTARGLNQTQLSKITGVSRNTISSYETGQFDPTVAHALVISKVLDCSIEDIWSLDDERLEEYSPCDICFKSECVGCKLGFAGADPIDMAMRYFDDLPFA